MKKKKAPAIQRTLGRDGKFNVDTSTSKTRGLTDIYHRLLKISWPKLLLFIVGYYLSANLIFAVLYMLGGNGALDGINQTSPLLRLLSTFFFSVQTFATIGYGRVTPVSIGANLLVTAEALVGLFSLAVMTGLVFARFSKPTARVIFSNFAVITPFQGVPSLIFRLANKRLNQIVEAQISATVSMDKKTAEGNVFRIVYDLDLLRSRNPIFVLSWTVVHPITPKSPIFGLSHDDLVAAQAEVVISLTGIDDTFSQSVHSRFSYIPEEIVWNRKFKDMFTRLDDGKLRVNYNLINEFET